MLKNALHDMQDEEKLKHYQSLLLKWQAKINLISPETISHSWERHYEDSLQISPLISTNATVVDMGSGAGFPGMVLAIARPDLTVSLIESDKKKCSFLKTVSRETETDVSIFNQRIDQCTDQLSPDIVTARALAPLIELFNYCRPWIVKNKNIKLIFLKGRQYQQELDTLNNKYSFDVQSLPSKTSPDGVVLIFSNIELVE
jgi:16S rRNA (guanine527-N7)-methyltransferase